MNNLVKGIENQFQNEHSELRFAKIEETLGELRNLIMQSRSASVVSLSPVVSVPLPPVVSVPLPPVVSVPLPPVVSGLTRTDFLHWRQLHPGPKSRSAFRVWVENGGTDVPHFRHNWRGRRGSRSRRGGVVVNHYTYN
ncbi:uncharacterized protein LOC136089032 isoform X2 [Hydra vulgaris]|uniref:uncharacterized protein LOC136089032 isoform X2 n=1 Tax=Hydra vulgaris TaxID=6087 RepID=UPI0032E9F546